MAEAPSPVAPPAAGPPGAWSPLRHAVFRALWIAGLASNLGTWMQNVGAAWLMTSLAPSPLWVSLVQVASNLPFFLLAVPAGALADVVDRRRLLVAALVWMALAAASLGVLTALGAVGPLALLGFTFAIGVGSTFLAPPFLALLPELVPREDIPAAVSLNGISMNLARAVGPALGGLTVAAAGAGVTFLANAASFLALLVVVLRWRRPPREAHLPPEELIGAIRAGVRYLRHSPPLQLVLVRVAVFVLPASALWALLPLYAKDELGLGAPGYGLLLGFFGAGAVIGGLGLPRLRRRFGPQRTTTAAALVFAGALVALGATSHLAAAAAALACAGAGWLALLTVLNAAAQLALPSWVRARGLAAYLLVLFGSLAVGSAGWGALAESAGVQAAFAGAGAAVAVSRLFVHRLRLPEGDGPDLTPAPRWPAPPLVRVGDGDPGPVLVTVEYEIDPADTAAFSRAMQQLGRIRLRDAALRWGLWEDTARPGRFLESFVVESWLEHLRQHERVTAADRAVQQTAHAFHRGSEPPRVTHFLHAEAPHAAG
jgi:MFS family permease